MSTTSPAALPSAAPSLTELADSRFIQIQGVEQAFKTPKGRFVALRDIDLTVAKGEFVALIGHSGCGKSTLLNLIAGLTRPTQGALLCANREIAGPGPDRAMVFQNHALYPHTCATSRSTRQAILKKRRISPTAARSTWLPSSRRTTTPALPATCGPTMAA